MRIVGDDRARFESYWVADPMCGCWLWTGTADNHRVMEILYGRSTSSVRRSEFQSARMFVDRMGLDSVIEAAEIAMAAPIPYRKVFIYFCGVCWNRIKGNVR